MTIRRSTATMLYAQHDAGCWLSSLAAAMDDAAAGLCRMYWQKGRSPVLQPVRGLPPPGAQRLNGILRRAH